MLAARLSAGVCKCMFGLLTYKCLFGVNTSQITALAAQLTTPIARSLIGNRRGLVWLLNKESKKIVLSFFLNYLTLRFREFSPFSSRVG